MTNTATADQLITMPTTVLRRVLDQLDVDALAALDQELARRAALLGKPGPVSKAHSMVKRAWWAAAKESA